jgi:Arm domain-containing DNA-binding protein/integrase-like protein
MALTDTEIKKAKPNEKSYRLSDSGGMYLWVTPSGGKLWRWGYRFEGKEKLMALGKYPAVSLALARERHGEARRQLATGTDPMALRKAEKTAEQVANDNSFASIAGEWLEHWQDGKSPRHVDSTRRRLDSNILPSLGALQIGAIEAQDIVAMVRSIEARGARDIAKRAMETTGQIFRYAIAHGKVRRNPAGDFHPSDVLKAARKTNYARIDSKELPHLLKEIEVHPELTSPA